MRGSTREIIKHLMFQAVVPLFVIPRVAKRRGEQLGFGGMKKRRRFEDSRTKHGQTRRTGKHIYWLDCTIKA